MKLSKSELFKDTVQWKKLVAIFQHLQETLHERRSSSCSSKQRILQYHEARGCSSNYTPIWSNVRQTKYKELLAADRGPDSQLKGYELNAGLDRKQKSQ